MTVTSCYTVPWRGHSGKRSAQAPVSGAEGPLSDHRGGLSLGSSHVYRCGHRNYEISGVMKITREDIKRFDDIRLIVLSALLGTALAKFDLDPSSAAAPFVGVTFIMSVILGAYGVHTISINSTRRYFWGGLCAIVFVVAIIILFMLSHFRGHDVTSGFIGIDTRGMFLIEVTIFVWFVTSLIVKWANRRLEIAAEDTAAKVMKEDEY